MTNNKAHICIQPNGHFALELKFIHDGLPINNFMMLSSLWGLHHHIGGWFTCGVTFSVFFVMYWEFGVNDGYNVNIGTHDTTFWENSSIF